MNRIVSYVLSFSLGLSTAYPVQSRAAENGPHRSEVPSSENRPSCDTPLVEIDYGTEPRKSHPPRVYFHRSTLLFAAGAAVLGGTVTYFFRPVKGGAYNQGKPVPKLIDQISPNSSWANFESSDMSDLIMILHAESDEPLSKTPIDVDDDVLYPRRFDRVIDAERRLELLKQRKGDNAWTKDVFERLARETPIPFETEMGPSRIEFALPNFYLADLEPARADKHKRDTRTRLPLRTFYKLYTTYAQPQGATQKQGGRLFFDLFKNLHDAKTRPEVLKAFKESYIHPLGRELADMSLEKTPLNASDEETMKVLTNPENSFISGWALKVLETRRATSQPSKNAE